MDKLLHLVVNRAMEIATLRKDIEEVRKYNESIKMQIEESKNGTGDGEQQRKDSSSKLTLEGNETDLQIIIKALKTQIEQSKMSTDELKMQMIQQEQLIEDLKDSLKKLQKVPEEALPRESEVIDKEEGSCEKVEVQQILSHQEVKAKSEGLLIAAGEGRVQDIHRLLKEGAHISYADFFKDTALHYAARNGHLGAVAALISAGATLDAINHKGSTPLHEAAKRGNRDVLSALIKAGAPVNTKNKYGLTPLHEATRQGHSECLEVLLKGGADANAKDIAGNRPLHFAYAFNRKKCQQVLLRRGANAYLFNSLGLRPLDVCLL